jgi:hypothetical protein
MPAKSSSSKSSPSVSEVVVKDVIKTKPKDNNGVQKKSSASAGKKRTEKAISQFLNDVLPALKKEMVRRKKEPFSWESYAHYFKHDSKYLPTFLLPLLKFLEKDEVLCSRYGAFENRHMVKTSDGFSRVMLLSKHCDENELTPDVQQYLTQRFGKEWFKIPAKDGFRAKAASASGHDGMFKVILTGLYEDSFMDSTTGETIYTINPSLIYEPCRPPAAKKEKKEKRERKAATERIPEGECGPLASDVGVDVGAQEIPLEPIGVKEEEESKKSSEEEEEEEVEEIDEE